MNQVQCPRCRMLYPVGPEWAGRSFACQCGNVVAVPAAAAPVPVPGSPLAFDYDDPAGDVEDSPRATRGLYKSRVSPDADANTKLTVGLVAIVLALLAFILAVLGSSAPLIQANSYVVPGICVAVAAVGVAIFGMCRVSGFSMLLTTGLVLGGIALIVCGLEAAAINEAWAKLARDLKRL